MYEKFYGLREKPFALRPDARFLYLAKHHMRALLLMEYGLINDASFLLITGEIGAGKTTLIRCLLERLAGSGGVAEFEQGQSEIGPPVRMRRHQVDRAPIQSDGFLVAPGTIERQAQRVLIPGSSVRFDSRLCPAHRLLGGFELLIRQSVGSRQGE